MTRDETKKYLEWIDANRPAMEHFAKGGEVELREIDNPSDSWDITDYPIWYQEFNYRPKPCGVEESR